ncbi:MAG TPA: gephyrin-like molybdotransferase Glp [Verrucomicrobiae bacterium]|nr:gephyrin-like molybdotransferase Glp [Verrucomicrobiae bacterium]
MKELFSVVTVDEAKQILASHMPELNSVQEEVGLLEGYDRRLAVDIVTPENLPPFSRSTVDGYAVCARDTFGVTESMPGFLTVTGEVEMGKEAQRVMLPGEAQWIPTGGMLPQGADAVVMVEYTEDVGGGLITIHRPVTVGENLILAGEDCSKGETVLTKDTRIRPAEMGLLAALGITRVKVTAKPRIAIISTGDEVVAPEETPRAGQIRDVNSYALAGQVIQGGGIPVCYGIVRDVAFELSQVLAKALLETDLVLISGGSSVGTRDMTAEVLSQGNPGILFHGVAIKPGKPTLAAVIGEKIVIGLPGHPASAMVVFNALVMPLLQWGSYQMAELHREYPIQAELTQSLASGPGREDYVRVKLEQSGEKLTATPVLGKSGLISTLVKADGMMRISLTKEGLNNGAVVAVDRL